MTHPELERWPSTDGTHSRSDISAIVGRGDEAWARASRDVLRWKVKTASGFAVRSTAPVTAGQQLVVTARILGVTVVEPVKVVAVVNDTDRVGFAYRTLPGHPVSGEEAFIVERHGDEVWLMIRSLTRPAPQQPWRMLYPLLQVAQRVARRRYLRAFT